MKSHDALKYGINQKVVFVAITTLDGQPLQRSLGDLVCANELSFSADRRALRVYQWFPVTHT